MKEKILNTFITRIFSAVFNFLIVIFLSHILGAEGKGEASLILTTIALIIIFCDFVGGASLVYLIPKNNLFPLLVPSYLWSILVSGLSFIAFFFYPLIPTEILIHVIIITLIQSFTNIHLKVLMAEEKMGWYNLINLLQSVLNFCILIFLFFGLEHKTVMSYLISLYISTSIAFLISLIFFPYRKVHISSDNLLKLTGTAFRYGFFNQMAHIFQFLSFRISYYLIGYFHGEKTVGIYSNGASIAESIWLISSSISLVQYSRIANSDDPNYNRNLTSRLTKISIILTSTIILILVFLPPLFFQIIFGEDFSEMALVIRFLAPGIIFFNIALVIGHYFSGTGRYYLNTQASGIGFCITLILGFILIPKMPLIGAALTASISYFITAIFVIWIFLKEKEEGIIGILPVKTDFLQLINELKKLWPGIDNDK